jgi:uncharacterized protein
MSPGQFKLQAELSRLGSRGEPAPATIRVVNVTRQKEIAGRVQLAGEGRNRRKGLLGRERLDRGEGLWIVPCEAVHTFCMRFPIDLIYLDRKHRVTKVRSNVGPWRLSVSLRAHSVIELPAGSVNETGTMPGDILAIERM